jgi:L-threonylcarbamoyladenylate synthase
MATIINISAQHQLALTQAVQELGEGYPIAIPTETVYGLAADATNPSAITRIYQTKGRPQFNPLICHMADLEMAERYAIFDPLSRKLAEAFWPGPLTLILPLRQDAGIHDLATAGLDSVGIRIPKGFASTLIRAFGRPLAAPSANSSGKISPTSAAHVDADLGNKINLVLDGGEANVGVESTIIKVEADGTVRLLRPGGLVADEIEAVIGQSLIRPIKASAIIEAPGMLASHYAPNASVRLNATSVEPHEALLTFGNQSIAGFDQATKALNLSDAGDLSEAAQNLFKYLKQLDSIGSSAIAVAAIPSHDLGEAINDRLSRAAAPRS